MADRTEIYLIRHGETDWNRNSRFQGQKDSSLNEIGRRQAAALARRLSQVVFAAIYSSDLGRARETAEILARPHSRPLITDLRLRERCFGIFEGHTIAELQETYPDVVKDFQINGYNFVVPGGESNTAIIERATECLKELAVNHSGQQVLVVTHGGIINRFTKYVLGIPDARYRMFRIHNVSINRYFYHNDRWELLTFGDISHLEVFHDGAEE